MCVSAPHAERTHACPSQPVLSLPFRLLIIDDERAAGKIDFRIGRAKMQRGRQNFVGQRQRSFNEARRAGSNDQMTEVAFY